MTMSIVREAGVHGDPFFFFHGGELRQVFLVELAAVLDPNTYD